MKFLSGKYMLNGFLTCLLTNENKQKQVEISRQLLGYLDNSFQNIITGDKTWLHFFTVSSKETNKVWLRAQCVMSSCCIMIMQRHTSQRLSPPYSPDMSPPDMDGIDRVKAPYKGKRYDTELELRQAYEATI